MVPLLSLDLVRAGTVTCAIAHAAGGLHALPGRVDGGAAAPGRHLGYDKDDPVGRNNGNSRNETCAKMVLTDVGPVEIDVPRDRECDRLPGIRGRTDE